MNTCKQLFIQILLFFKPQYTRLEYKIVRRAMREVTSSAIKRLDEYKVSSTWINVDYLEKPNGNIQEFQVLTSTITGKAHLLMVRLKTPEGLVFFTMLESHCEIWDYRSEKSGEPKTIFSFRNGLAEIDRIVNTAVKRAESAFDEEVPVA